MVKLILEGGFLQFDGEVIELFGEKGENSRYHIRYLDRIYTESGRKGIMLLNLRYGKGGGGFSGWIIPTDHVEEANQFIQTVEEAKKNYYS